MVINRNNILLAKLKALKIVKKRKTKNNTYILDLLKALYFTSCRIKKIKSFSYSNNL